MSRDTSKATAVELAEVEDREFTDEELSGFDAASRVPAFEEGPHLKDPEVRRLKRQQMKDAGWTGKEDFLTDDMRTILTEKVKD